MRHCLCLGGGVLTSYAIRIQPRSQQRSAQRNQQCKQQCGQQCVGVSSQHRMYRHRRRLRAIGIIGIDAQRLRGDGVCLVRFLVKLQARVVE